MKSILLWRSWYIATLPLGMARSSANTLDLECSDLPKNQRLVISAYHGLFEAKCNDVTVSLHPLSADSTFRIYPNNVARGAIQKLDAPLVNSLSFVSQGYKTSPPISISINAFTHLSALDSFTLDVRFPSIPTFIRHLKAERTFKIDGVQLKAGARTILTQEQFESLSDLSKQTNVFTDAVFDPYCESRSHASPAGNTVSAVATDKHVVCYEVSPRPGSPVESSKLPSNTGKPSPSSFSIWMLFIVVGGGIIAGLALAASVVRLSVINAAAPMKENSSRSTRLLRPTNSEFSESKRDLVQLLELDANELNLLEAINPNDFWLGELDTCLIVAKKIKIMGDDTNGEKSVFRYLIQIASIKHENIVSMIGHTWRTGSCLTIVTEYMEKGSLGIALHDPKLEMDNLAKFQMCLDIARALSHLHENEMCVRQFTSRSVLVNGVKTAKISLFHMEPSSKEIRLGEKTNEFSLGSGEVAWSAAEVVKGEKSIDPFMANIYTFGVIIGEIWTRNMPFKTLVEEMGSTLADAELIRRMQRHEMLAPHEHHSAYLLAPQGVRDVVSLCLSVAPHMRPCAKDLVVALQAVKSQL
uniref:Protein kinase putative n=1 Tax=Albugo laibachii Nc14 TaxID=890382 RepID=F0WKD0_9STRA|nr:protein kinase putative [Albugo laibachii Nc14]|eukprot:CCA21734.1 protein kinase putative [Albugo laibachii Nc14]